MKKIILIPLLLISLRGFCQDDLFQKANDLYSNERYDEAINLYDSIIHKKLESPELYYNLANCYYKLSDWVNAIYYYEKSNKLKRNKETEDNLKLANMKIFDSGKIVPIPEFMHQKWWREIQRIFNTKAWQYLTISSVWIFFFLWLLYKIFNQKTKRFSSVFLSLAILCFIFGLSSYKVKSILREAIIFDSEVIVNSSPAIDGIEKFVLHSGTKVKILEEIDDWIKIELLNGQSGWVLTTTCREI